MTGRTTRPVWLACAFVLGWLLAFTQAADAEETYRAATQSDPGVPLVFRHLGPDNGLSSWRANQVLQDRAGYVWIATPNGLDRFDGYKVKTYRNDPTDRRSLSGSYISALYEDRAGRLWVGTQAGLDVYDPRTDGFDRKVGVDAVASV